MRHNCFTVLVRSCTRAARFRVIGLSRLGFTAMKHICIFSYLLLVASLELARLSDARGAGDTPANRAAAAQLEAQRPETPPKPLLGTYPAEPLLLRTGTNAFAAFRDGSKIVSACDRSVNLWDMTDGRLVRRLEHPEVVIALALAPAEDTLLTATAGRQSPIRLWSLETAKLLKEYSGRCPEMVAATREEKSQSRGWSFPFTQHFSESGFGFTSVAYSPDGRHFAAGCDNGPHLLWESETGAETMRTHASKSRPRSIVLSPDGKRLLIANTDFTAELWDLEVRRLVKQYLETRHQSGADASIPAAFSSDGRQFAFYGLESQAIHICDARTGEDVRLLPGRARRCSIAFLPENRLLFSNSRNVLEIWQTASARLTRRHVCKSGIDPFSSYPNIEYAAWLPSIGAAMAVEVDNNDNTSLEDWTTISIVPLSAFEEVPH